jgi:hypothetical protein
MYNILRFVCMFHPSERRLQFEVLVSHYHAGIHATTRLCHMRPHGEGLTLRNWFLFCTQVYLSIFSKMEFGGCGEAL